VLLALTSAVSYGVSDFTAGLASRRFSIITVTFLASVCSLVLTLAVLPWVASATPSATALGWGAASGLGGLCGALALYAGYRHAAFSVAGPLSAVSAAGLSVIVGILIGERPAAMSLAGIGIALPAIVLVSLTAGRPGPDPPAAATPAPDSPAVSPAAPNPPAAATPDQPAGAAPEPPAPGMPEPSTPVTPEPSTPAAPGFSALRSPRPASPAAGPDDGVTRRASQVTRFAARLLSRGAWPGVATGLVAGVGFALLFIGLDRAGQAAGLWPVLASQAAEIVAIVGLLTWRRGLRGGPPGTGIPPGTAVLAVLTGVTGGAGTIFYFLATHHGFLAITAVLTSLYPAVTIALARLVASERLSAARFAGLLLAGVSVTLIALGGAA
jgi:drug/metabolite transporter (DMT)-like permease